MLERSQEICLKKIKECEENLNILESDRWDPFDPIYSDYFNDYCKRKLELMSDTLRKLRNEYIFNNTRLYDKDHKGKILAFIY